MTPEIEQLFQDFNEWEKSNPGPFTIKHSDRIIQLLQDVHDHSTSVADWRKNLVTLTDRHALKASQKSWEQLINQPSGFWVDTLGAIDDLEDRHRCAIYNLFPEGRLRFVYLAGAKLDAAKLMGASLEYADLSCANLEYANLSKADLRGADLSGADISEGNFSGANLEGADLRGANCAATDFTGANLQNADFTGADLFRTNFKKTKSITPLFPRQY